MTTRAERTYLICVDASDTAVREALTSRILRLGSRIQFSVFAVPATPLIFAELHRDLSSLVLRQRAHVVIFDVGVSATAVSRVIELGCALHSPGATVFDSLRTPNGWFA